MNNPYSINLIKKIKKQIWIILSQFSFLIF
jgi:hypothetical protein